MLTAIKIFFGIFVATCVMSCQNPKAQTTENIKTTATMQQEDFAIAIHGGAGSIKEKNMTANEQKAYHEKLNEALMAGVEVLKNGGTALDAVQASINIMENSPLFNAGKGAVLTHKGKVSMDASIMDGKTLKAGAVAGIHIAKNPISVARAVMEGSPHVMLSGKGADIFARKQGLEIAEPDYFITEKRKKQLQKAIEMGKSTLDNPEEEMQTTDSPQHLGTVGAVALDIHGNLAAGTSTGGMTNKRFGRIGDSPIIGSGTYANNKTCAVSSTGHGEYFIRAVVAYDISALMQYKGWSLEKAANYVIMEKLIKMGGAGGVIAIDANGNIAMPYNTPGMFRAYYTASGEKEIAMF